MAKSNFYEGSIEYRLIDTDSVTLSSPNYIIIEEPFKFDVSRIILKRDPEDRGGVNYEFSDNESAVGFYGRNVGGTTSVKSTIETIMAANGSDSNIRLEIRRDSTLIYQGDIVPSSYDRSDEAIYFRLKRFDAGNKIKTRWSTPIDLESTTDLDDNAITALTLRDIPLHSKVTQYKYEASAEERIATDLGFASLFLSEWDMDELNDNTDTNFLYLIPSMETTTRNDLDGIFNYGNVVFGKVKTVSDSLVSDLSGLTTPTSEKFYIFDFQDREGKITFNMDFEGKVSINKDSFGGADTFTNVTFLVSQEIRVYSEGQVLKASYTKGTQSFVFTGTPFTDSSLSLSSSQEIELERGDKVYYYIQVNPSVTGLSIVGDVDNMDFSMREILSTTTVDIDALTTEVPSSVEGGYWNEVLDKCLEMATGQSGMLESTLFQNRPVDSTDEGCGGLNFITTGDKIRQRDVNLRLSIDQLISYAKSRHGAGWAYYYDSGTLKLLVEKQSHFFQNKKIMTISDVQNPVIKKINKEILFNEITVGFEKYAKPNESGTSEGFSTQTEYLTPIQKDQKKLSILSKIIGDGTEIERVRRNGIKNAADQSDEKDDDPFVISIQEFDNTVKYNPATYGSGNRLNIQRDADNDRIIINGLIIMGLSTNDYIIIDSQTNRQISGAPVLDYDNNRTVLPCTTETQNDTIYNAFYFATDSLGSTPIRTYNPRRLEGFADVLGLIDKFSAYNIDHTNSQFLLHNFPWFGGSLEKKGSFDDIIFLRKKAITILDKEYTSSTCGLTTTGISEDQNFTMANLRNWSSEIFGSHIYEFEARMSFTDLLTLKEALRNESASDINFGYIDFADNDGTTIEAFPFLVDYNPLNEMVKIIAWEKA